MYTKRHNSESSIFNFSNFKTIIGIILAILVLIFSVLVIMTKTSFSLMGLTLVIPDDDASLALPEQPVIFMKAVNEKTNPPRGELVTFDNDGVEVLVRVIDSVEVDGVSDFYVSGGEFIEHKIGVDDLVRQGSFLIPNLGKFVTFLVTPVGLLVCLGFPLIAILILLLMHFMELPKKNNEYRPANVDNGKRARGKKSNGYNDPYEDSYDENSWPQNPQHNNRMPNEHQDPRFQNNQRQDPRFQNNQGQYNERQDPRFQNNQGQYNERQDPRFQNNQGQYNGQQQYQDQYPEQQYPDQQYLDQQDQEQQYQQYQQQQQQYQEQPRSRPTVESILADVTGHNYNFEEEDDDKDYELDYENHVNNETMPLQYSKPDTVDTDEDSNSLIITREFFIAELQPEDVSKAHEYNRGAGFQANLNDYEKNNFNIDGIDVNVDSNNIQLAISEDNTSDIFITVTEEFTNVVVNKENLETSFALFKDDEDDKNKVIIRKKQLG